MNLNDLLKMVLSNLDGLNIEYSYIDGQESLKVNGEEICTCEKNCECKKYDDSELIRKIENHKKLLNSLDDCTFMDVTEILKEENVNLCALNNFMEKEHYSKEDEIIAEKYISLVSDVIRDVISMKLDNLEYILTQLPE